MTILRDCAINSEIIMLTTPKNQEELTTD